MEQQDDCYFGLITLRRKVTDRITAIENGSMPKYEGEPGAATEAYMLYHEYLKVICDLILWRAAQGENMEGERG